jgi:large subunit ribosomal protein L10
MNREQKAATIEALATEIQGADAIFAVDYRGISVPQAAELRIKLREADATFKVVKNSLTERAADQVGAQTLKPLLQGPTALTFVRGDAALAAKALADYARITQLLPFKGGLMDGAEVDADQIRAISRLPSRQVLYGQLVGIVASPISGLVRTLNALVGGLAVALGQVQEKKQSGEIPAGDPPTAVAAPDAPAAEAESADAVDAPDEPAAEADAADSADAPTAEAEPADAADAPAEPADAADAPAEPADAADASDAPAAEAAPEAPAADGVEAATEQPAADQAEPEPAPAQDEDETPADASA